MGMNGSRHGFTLLELVSVLAIVAILSVLAVASYSGFTEKARRTAALSDMAAIREAFMGSATEPGYLADLSPIPGFSPDSLRIANLLVATNFWTSSDGAGGPPIRADVDSGRAAEGFAEGPVFRSWDPDRGRGWRGPYLRLSSGERAQTLFPAASAKRPDNGLSAETRGFYPTLPASFPASFRNRADGRSVYGFPGQDPSVQDPWGNPYVLQIPPAEAFTDASPSLRFAYARIVSAGPNGRLETPCFAQHGSGVKDGWRDARLAGLRKGGDASARGDDLVLFLSRADLYEEDLP